MDVVSPAIVYDKRIGHDLTCGKSPAEQEAWRPVFRDIRRSFL
ncbi:hypothetical protein [Sphingomonas faeni]